MFQEDNKIIDKSKTICHSGGAIGSDLYWEKCCKEYKIPTKHYSYKTTYHNSINKVEISDDEKVVIEYRLKRLVKLSANAINSSL